MYHPDTPDEERIEQVILQSVRRILEHQDAARFLDWAREAIPGALGLADEGLTPEEGRRLAMLLATAIWNATPLPSEGFRPRPLSGAGDGPCPCGSGLPHQDCCGAMGEAPELSADLIWELLLDELPERQLKLAVADGAVPAHLLGAVADRWLGEDRPGRAVSLLEPLFEGDEIGEFDARFDPALNVLCDAYDRLDHWKKKREFLDRMSERGSRALRAAAWQRLSTIYIDEGDFEQAGAAFTQALRLDPESPGIAVLEITLLAAQHEDALARQRAGFWRRKLARQGMVDEEIMAFLARAGEDPQDALMASQAAIIDPVLLTLRDWIGGIGPRALPDYRLEGCGGGAEPVPAGQLSLFGEDAAAGAVHPADLTRAVRLRPSQALRRLEVQWHQVYPAPKPLSTRLSPLFEGDLWEEEGWIRFLLEHPDAADSLDILDDLATALYLHPESSLPWVARALLVPVLERGRRIVEHSLVSAQDRVIPWTVQDNRPALRLLFRLYLFREEGRYETEAGRILETLLRLNPDDNHGVRAELMNHYLRRGEDEHALELATRFPEDPLADLAYGEVLALYRLGRRDRAARALSHAVGRLPRIPHYLTRKRVRQPPVSPAGVTPGGDDQAWLYREAMRDVWEAEPGVLAWLKKHIG